MPRRIWMYLRWTALSFFLFAASRVRLLPVSLEGKVVSPSSASINQTVPTRHQDQWTANTALMGLADMSDLVEWTSSSFLLVTSKYVYPFVDFFLSFSFSLPFGPRRGLVNSYSFISFKQLFFFSSPLSSCHLFYYFSVSSILSKLFVLLWVILSLTTSFFLIKIITFCKP